MADYATTIKEYNGKPIDTMLERMESESYESNVNFKIKGGEELGAEADLNLKIEHDAVTENSLATLSGNLEIEDRKLVTEANFFSNKDKIGLKVDELHDNYLVIENRDLKKLAKMFGMDEDDIKDIPDEIPETDYAANKAKIEQLYIKYTNRFFEQISKDKYTVEKDVTTNVDEKDIVTNKYSLIMTDKEFATIAVNILKEMIDDPDFVSLFNNEKAVDSLKDSIKDVEKDLEEFTDEETMTMSVYVANKKAVKFDLISTDISAVLVVTNNDSESKMLYSISADSTNVDFTMTNNFANGKGKLEFRVKDDTGEEGSIILNTTDDGDKIEIEFDYDIEELDEYKKYFSIKSDTKFDSSINVKDIDKDAEVLNDYTEEDFEKLATTIAENLTKLEENEDGSYPLIKSLFAIYQSNYMSGSSSLFNNDTSSNDTTSHDFVMDSSDDSITTDNDTDRDTNTDATSTDIEEEGKKVEDEVESAIDSLLSQYHLDKITNEDADPNDYLTEEKIADKCVSDVEVIDSTTLKCTTTNDNVFFVKIDIDGENWKLNSVKAEYSVLGE